MTQLGTPACGKAAAPRPTAKTGVVSICSVANVPLALGIAPPEEIFKVDRRRIFGLISSANTLAEIRKMRMRELGMVVPHYADNEQISRELDEARALMRKVGCIVINTDGRAVEETAQEILRYVGGGLSTGD